MKTRPRARSIELGISLLFVPVLRSVLLYLMRRAIRARLDDSRAPVNQRKIIQHRGSMALAIVQTFENSVKRGCLSPGVARISGGLWGKLLLGWNDRRVAARDFRENTLRNPPLFMAISPGQACNLSCEGCYASSDSRDTKLEWSLVDRIISDAKRLWNIKLIVISGGEPLVYASEGRGILDIVQEHPDLLFLMFTNGTLLNYRDIFSGASGDDDPSGLSAAEVLLSDCFGFTDTETREGLSTLSLYKYPGLNSSTTIFSSISSLSTCDIA